eukprot:jgi/Mesen1/2065/ME000150S01150
MSLQARCFVAHIAYKALICAQPSNKIQSNLHTVPSRMSWKSNYVRAPEVPFAMTKGRDAGAQSDETLQAEDGHVAPVESTVAGAGQLPASFRETIQVDAALLRFLVGNGREVQRRVEEKAGIRLEVPRMPSTSAGTGSVVVSGSTEESVGEATRLIHEILQDAGDSSRSLEGRQRRPPPPGEDAGFPGLPKGGERHISNHGAGRNGGHSGAGALRGAQGRGGAGGEGGGGGGGERGGGRGIDASIFVSPATLHVTVQMLKLWSDERVARAAAVLEEALPKVHAALEGRPMHVRVGGLRVMRGDPSVAHVVYARVVDADGGIRLSQACHLGGAFVLQGGYPSTLEQL